MFPINMGLGRGRGRGFLNNLVSTPISQPGFVSQPRKLVNDFAPSSNNSETLSPESEDKSPKFKCSRKGRQKEELDDFFTKMLPKYYNRYGITASSEEKKSCITPKRPPKVSEEISLHEIPTPTLNSKEKPVSDFEQELLITLKKCEMVGRYDIIPPEDFTLWLREASEDKISYLAEARITNGEGPHKFYLMWKRNVYILKLMQNWLKSLVEENKLEDIESDDLEDLNGGWVAALAEDCNWYRAKVTAVYCGDNVSVTYPDRGETFHALPLERIKHLPENLWYHSSLCFRAVLAGVPRDDAEWDSNESINKGFIQQMEILDSVGAEIVGTDENDTVEVNLWDNFEEGCTGITVNEKVCKYIADWSKDIRYGLTPEDIQKMTIKENTEVFFDKAKIWQLVKVITPSYFTVRFTQGMDKWNERMQNFYSGLDPGRLRIRQGRVEPLQCYVYYCSERSSWDRAQIVTADNEKKTCQIYFWDTGIYTATKFDNLRKLIPQFCSQPPEAYRCHLVHVQPITDENSNQQPKWSPRAIEEFRRLAPEQSTTTGVIISYSKLEIKNVGMRLNLGVLLLDQKDEFEGRVMKNSLQYKLCELELATATGISAGGWDILQKFQKHKIASPEVSPVFMNESSPLLWKKTYDYYTEWVDPKATEKRKFMPTEIRKHLCWVKLIRANSPMCIFVQIQEQIPSLMFMMNRLHSYVKSEPPVSLHDIKPGLFMAVYCRVGHADDEHCYRAIVTEILQQKKIQVFLIDFGIPFIASIEDTRALPRKFLQQSSYAHRIHLDYPNLVPKCSATYSKECCDFFRKYIKIWNFACPIYYLWQRRESQIIELDDIYQNLEYNYAEERLEKCKLETKDYNSLRTMKNNPIISHLFVSVGVVLEYENFNPPNKPYTFSLLHKVIVDKEFAVSDYVDR